MKKYLSILCILLWPTTLLALQEPLEEIYGFLAGEYLIVGKQLNSTETYQGSATIHADEDHIRIEKRIGDQQIQGKGGISRTSMVESRVLKIRFQDAGQEFEQACLFHSDMDNYARITCHIYQPDIPTEDPGMEAWFIRR